MMHREFEELSGITVSWKVYHDIIEPMYIAADVDKREFVKMLNLDYFNSTPCRSFVIVKINMMPDSDNQWHYERAIRAINKEDALREFFDDLDESGHIDPEWRYDVITLSEAHAIMMRERDQKTADYMEYDVDAVKKMFGVDAVIKMHDDHARRKETHNDSNNN